MVNNPEGETVKRKLVVAFVVFVIAALGAGWKWGAAHASPGIECSPYCATQDPPPIGLPIPEPGPCRMHGGVVWVVRIGETLWYGCLDGSVIPA